MRGLLPLLVTGLLTTMSVQARPDVTNEWRFRVSLDGREIGYHQFTLQSRDGLRRVHSEADFEVRLLFMTLYRYRHEAIETWRDDCLSSMESETDANGRPLRVRGQQDDGAFVVESPGGVATLPGCVMSFAYWNPAFLEQDRLLNPQDGEFIDVESSGPVMEALQLNGREFQARRFRLDTTRNDIELWYSPQGDWLALETQAEGGRILRYERVWASEPAL